MKYRTLGRTGLKVSEIGVGTWGMGKDQWVDASDSESTQALRKCFDLGINFYDTALAYGEGHSEKLLAGLHKSVGRQHVILATKVPPLNRVWPAACGLPTSKVFPPSHIRESTEKSLRNLQTDRIDLLQLHVWQDHWLEESGWMEELQKLKKEGKIRFVGVSVNDHDPLSAILLAQHRIADVVQVIYNIFDPTPEHALFPLCQEHHIGVIARCPFDEGGLTGQITSSTTFEKNDFRAKYFEGNRPAQVEERTNKLKSHLHPEAKTLPELALRFCLSNPVVSTVIPGMRKVLNVEANASVSDGRLLSPALLKTLSSHEWPRNFYPA